jgi:hypothetical protein
MKRAIHIRCTLHFFLYFSSHKKSLKQLHVIVCFSSAFTIYQHILLTNVYLGNPRKCKKKVSGTIVMLFLRAKVIPVNLQIHANVMRPLYVLNFIFELLFVHVPDIVLF